LSTIGGTTSTILYRQVNQKGKWSQEEREVDSTFQRNKMARESICIFWGLLTDYIVQTSLSAAKRSSLRRGNNRGVPALMPPSRGRASPRNLRRKVTSNSSEDSPYYQVHIMEHQ
jgi:hypothetical protein